MPDLPVKEQEKGKAVWMEYINKSADWAPSLTEPAMNTDRVAVTLLGPHAETEHL